VLCIDSIGSAGSWSDVQARRQAHDPTPPAPLLPSPQRAQAKGVEVVWESNRPYEHTLECKNTQGAVTVRGLTLRHYSKSVAQNYCVLAQVRAALPHGGWGWLGLGAAAADDDYDVAGGDGGGGGGGGGQCCRLGNC